MRARWLVVAALIVALVATAPLLMAGYQGHGLFGRLGTQVDRADPVSWQTLSDYPNVLFVKFPVGDGYCPGLWKVLATETDDAVLITTVEARYARDASCPGVGVSDGLGSAEYPLQRPLGARKVVRTSDGAELPRTKTRQSE